jgi:hypothetical protein
MGTLISYRPAAFYHRQDLRAARTLEALRDIALHLAAEVELLRHWIAHHGFARCDGGVPSPGVARSAAPPDFRWRIETGTDFAALLDVALALVCDYENLWQWIRDTRGVNPPRRHLSSPKVRAKPGAAAPRLSADSRVGPSPLSPPLANGMSSPCCPVRIPGEGTVDL